MTPIDQILLAASQRPLTTEELGILAVTMENTREDRLVLDRSSKVKKDFEVKCNSVMVDQMLKHKLQTIAEGRLYRLSDKSDEPSVSDWQKFWGYILEEQDLSLLEKRVSVSAVKERWLAGETVPGVEKYPVYKVLKEKVN